MPSFGSRRASPRQSRPERRRSSPVAVEALEGRHLLAGSLATAPIAVPLEVTTAVVAIGHYRSHGVTLPFLAATHTGDTGGVEIALGNARGGFRKAVFRRLDGGMPEGIAVGRFTNSGRDDLVVVADGGNLYYLRGLPGGRFGPPLVEDIGTKTATFVATLPDPSSARGKTGMLVVSDYNYDQLSQGRMRIYRVGGPKDIEEVASYGGVVGAERIVVNDFNRDGKMDFAVANKLDNDDTSVVPGRRGFVTVYQGQPDNSFAIEQFNLITADGEASHDIKAIGLAASDFDGDGRVDLAVAEFKKDGRPGDAVHILANTTGADNIIRFVDRLRVGGVGRTLLDVEAVRLGDARPGLAVSSTDDARVTVLPNLSTPGSFRFGDPEVLGLKAADEAPGLLAASDLTGRDTGVDDLVVPVHRKLDVFRNSSHLRRRVR